MSIINVCNIRFLAVLFVGSLLFVGCGNRIPAEEISRNQISRNGDNMGATEADSLDTDSRQAISSNLLVLNESERRQGYQPGMGLALSSYYEQLGYLVPAVFAACADLSYAYAGGSASLADYNNGLDALAKSWQDQSSAQAEKIRQSISAVRAFLNEDWSTASELLSILQESVIHEDSFQTWMFLVSKLEADIAMANESIAWHPDEILITKYGSIMTRYRSLPQYWYHAMRFGLSDNLRLDAAERCINLAPQGPYALPARETMSELWSLPKDSAVALMTIQEIQILIQTASATANLEELRKLFPLLALADNPSTLYALGALQGLADSLQVRSWLQMEAEKAKGRLADRLRYVGGRKQ